ncbi:conjugal transfer protein TraF [Vibrio splendidus]|nr:conjugal transfer protein TraF [Vibrio splendidus]MCC4880761.1 conjugal transfer protein TraF [Vibrio splendidus]
MNKLAISMAVLTAFSASASASFDSRSVAMGGIGASTSTYLTAPFHNPALAAKYSSSDDIGILLPAFGASVQDKGDLIDGFDAVSDSFDDLVQTDSDESGMAVASGLKDLVGDSASIQSGAGIALALPNKYVSVNVFAKAHLDAFVFSDVDENELIGNNVNPEGLNSTGNVAGVAIIEVGASLAKSMELGNGTFYYGMTPKVQHIELINYKSAVSDFNMDDFDEDENRESNTGFNVDLGAAYQFNNGIALGLVGTNLIATEFGNDTKYSLNPVFTASASYNAKLLTVGIDVDLNETERFESISSTYTLINGSDDNTQLAAIGAEFNAWDWAQIRAGYQMDIAGNLENSVTAGIGLSPFGALRIDIAASYAGDNQAGVSLQTSLTF